jgi:ABC-type multidrug transport system fused ATPase/permease subunit
MLLYFISIWRWGMRIKNLAVSIAGGLISILIAWIIKQIIVNESREVIMQYLSSLFITYLPVLIGFFVFFVIFLVRHYLSLSKQIKQLSEDYKKLMSWIQQSPIDPYRWETLEEKITRLIDIKRPKGRNNT